MAVFVKTNSAGMKINKELIDKSVCDEGFIWNPSNSDCECNKSYDVGDYYWC